MSKSLKFFVFLLVLLKVTCPNEDSFLKYLFMLQQGSTQTPSSIQILYQTVINIAKTIRIWEFKSFHLFSLIFIKRRRVFGLTQQQYYLGILSKWFPIPSSLHQITEHVFQWKSFQDLFIFLVSIWKILVQKIFYNSSSYYVSALSSSLNSVFQNNDHNAFNRWISLLSHEMYSTFSHFSITELLIMMNVVIFVMWQILPEEYMLKKYAISYWQTIKQSRFSTLITANFSHQQIFHLINNMYGLSLYGTLVQNILGWKKFVAFYFISCIMTTVVSLVSRHYFPILMRKLYSFPMFQPRRSHHTSDHMRRFSDSGEWSNQDFVYSLGASGCVIALRTFYALHQLNSMSRPHSFLYSGMAHTESRFFDVYQDLTNHEYFAQLSSDVLRQHLIGHLLLDAVVSRNALVDIGGHFGGFLSGLLWSYYIS